METPDVDPSSRRSRSRLPPNALGSYLRTRRQRLNLSLLQVAAQAAVPYGTLQRYERGYRPPGQVLQRLAATLQVSPRVLRSLLP